MKHIILMCAVFMASMAHAQTYINHPAVSLMYEKVKQEYKDNNITETNFHNIDSIIVKDLDYPDVGYWKRLRGRDVIYIHSGVLTSSNRYALEYVLKHEIGHAHNLKHNTDILSIMCSFHEPAMSPAAWELMNQKYYIDLYLRPSVE